jgi:hypothetical protein
MIEVDSIGNFVNLLILDAFSYGAFGLRTIDSMANVEQKTMELQSEKSIPFQQYRRLCDWCGIHKVDVGNGRFCSLRCESEWEHERRRRNGY